jgi:phage baseplate assembly protein W
MADENLERELLRRRALGWAPALLPVAPGLDLGRDLAFARGPGGLDFARVSGFNTLAQSLTLALTTALGSDIFNTAFGSDALNAIADEADPLLARERVRVAVIRVIKSDPRVRRIIDVKLADGQLDLPQPGSRELNVRVVFETITGEQVALAAGRELPNV